MTFTKYKYILSSVILLLLIGFLFLNSPSDNKLHIFFCDVGQGDGIYIRFPNNQDMLIDGGPGNKILDCLSDNMPFYDREIDLVMLTHPQADHLNGLVSVIERYSVSYFVSSPVGNTTDGYKKLTDLLHSKKIEIKNLYTGGEVKFGNVVFKSIWPEKTWVLANLKCDLDPKCQTIANNSNILGVTNKDPQLNDFSEMGILSYGNFDVLFTGDGDKRIQDDILKVYNNDIDIEVMKVPHHGSKTGLTEDFLKAFKPELAIISVGKNNSYGHPSPELLQMLSKYSQIKRTDTGGTIEVVSDGYSWKVVN